MTVRGLDLSRPFKAFLAVAGLIVGFDLSCALAQSIGLSPAAPAAPERAFGSTAPSLLQGPTPLLVAPPPSPSASFVLSPPRQATPFPIVLNQSVKRYIDEYIRNIPDFRARFYGMYPFFRDMVHELAHYGVPPDFIYLAFAESAFARYSRGPWQLNKATARDFGLRVNRWVDERLDPLKSTRAAAEYLASLHDLLGDWRLTIVAWNTGENSALPLEHLKYANDSELSEFLPRRTRALLNRFMAVAFIAHHPALLGFNLASFTDDSVPSSHSFVTVPPATSLKYAATMAHTTVGVIRALNPALLRDRVPPDESYSLRVPIVTAIAKSLQGGF